MKLLLLSAILMVVPSIFAENIFLDNLKPEEAQKYLTGHDLSLKYAPKIGEGPIPLARAGNGESWYRGRKLSNPGDYLEDTYLANQFHGQDGLGRALFGYSDWNQGRVEAINGNGQVRGSYKYVDPYGKDFVAHYWSDGLGFHQEDNRPKVELKPVTDTPAVQRARNEHFRRYNEIVEEHAKAGADPYSDYYNRESNRYDEDQDKIDQVSELIGSTSNQHQALTRYPNLSQHKPVIPDHDYNPASSQDSVTIDRQYDNNNNNNRDGKYNRNYDPEPTGPPHGFYYNFDYPVYLLRNVKEGSQYGADYKYNTQPEYSTTSDYKNNNNDQFSAARYDTNAKYETAGRYDNNHGQYNNGQFNNGQYNNGQFDNGQNIPQQQQPYESEEYKKYKSNQQFGQNIPQQQQQQPYESEEYKKYKSNQQLVNNNDFTKYHHKRTVEEELASPAVKSVGSTESRVDAVHDAQVSPKQRSALEAAKAETESHNN